MPRSQPKNRRPSALPGAASQVHLAELGQRIAQFRNLQGLSASDLARLAGISPGRLKKIESGQGRLEASLIYALVVALNVKVADIFAEGEEPQLSPLDPEARQLMRFFSAIRSADVRRSILKFARSLSEKP